MIALAGCAKLDETEACDLAVSWLENKGFPAKAGGYAEDWELASCSHFRSIEDGALVDVSANWEGAERTDDGGARAVTVLAKVSCALIKYDQGWDVEACVPI